MRRYTTVVIAVAFVLVACSDSGDAVSVEAFCEADAEVEAAPPPSDLAGTVDEARASIDQWVSNAPADIQPQVEMFANRLTRLVDVWEAGDFDRASIDQAEFDAAFESFFAEDLSLASDEIIAWVGANCPEA